MRTFQTTISYKGKTHGVYVNPSYLMQWEGVHQKYQVVLDNQYLGDVYCAGTRWEILATLPVEQELIDLIGDLIFRYTQ